MGEILFLVFLFLFLKEKEAASKRHRWRLRRTLLCRNPISCKPNGAARIDGFKAYTEKDFSTFLEGVCSFFEKKDPKKLST